MLILGIETAGPTASAALMRDGALLAEYALHHTRTHSETVMPMAEGLLSSLGLTPRDLDAVAVDCGPGSFTGVRIGVCAANAMGAALCIPVVGVDALRALYENVRLWPGTVCALVDARNESAYWALYAGGDAVRAPAADLVKDLLPLMPAGALLVGDGAQTYGELIRSFSEGAVLAPDACHFSRAGALCAVAAQELRRLREEGASLPTEAAPLYLRPSQAERMWSMRQAGRE